MEPNQGTMQDNARLQCFPVSGILMPAWTGGCGIKDFDSMHPSVSLCLFVETLHLSKHGVSVVLGIGDLSCLKWVLSNNIPNIEKDKV